MYCTVVVMGIRMPFMLTVSDSPVPTFHPDVEDVDLTMEYSAQSEAVGFISSYLDAYRD